MSVKELTRELVTNPRIAAGIAAETTISGLGTWFDYIPDDIGKLATLIGAVLSIILISNWVLAFRKTLWEIKIMRRKEQERLANIESLRRRHTDKN